MGRVGHCSQHILEAGLKVLSLKGYNGTGVKEIVDAAGVPKGSFYNHFASKEAFVVEAVEKLAEETLTKTEGILTNAGVKPRQRLLNLFDCDFKFLQDNEFKHGCLFGNLCLEMSDENEAIRQATNRTLINFTKLIENCLTESQMLGELSSTINVTELAEFIHFSWEGAVMRMKGSKSGTSYSVFRDQVEKLLA